MSTDIHKTRIEIIRDKTVISTIEPPSSKVKDDFSISSSNSIYSFPTLNIKSSSHLINSEFLGFSNFDLVRLSVSNNNSNDYTTVFEGEFNKKTTKLETNPQSLVLDIEAIHSFYRLSMFELASTQDLTGSTFGEIVINLTEMAGIGSKISINELLSNTKIIGTTKNTNAFRVFKELCLIMDAHVTFNSDNTVEIDYRRNRQEEIRSRQVTTLTDEDIISAEFKDSM